MRLRGESTKRPLIDRVHSDLEFNFVIFKDALNRLLVIISLDALYVGTTLPEIVESELSARCGDQQFSFLWAASHTHFAPALDGRVKALGGEDRVYVDALGQRIAKALIEAVDCGFGRFSVARYRLRNEFAINRRRKYVWPTAKWFFRGIDFIYLAPNPGGEVSRRIDVVLVGDRKSPMAVMWAMACHPTSLPVTGALSSEFPGVVRDAIRQRFGRRDLPVIFFQGFSGELRSRYRGFLPQSSPMERLRQLAMGPRFAAPTLEQWQDWSDRVAASICASFEQDANAVEPDTMIAISTRSLPLAQVVHGARHDFDITATALRIAPNLSLTAVSAEMSCAYERVLDDDTIPVGCAGACVGYIPTNRQREEGGYEGRYALSVFETGRSFKPNIETDITELLHQTEAGRKQQSERIEVLT